LKSEKLPANKRSITHAPAITMRTVPLILISLLLCGCHRSNTGSKENDLTISVRQPWADAVNVVKRSGLTPEGLCLDLPHDEALLVFRGSKTNTVAALQRVEHWSVNKSERKYFELQSYELPAKQ
jgi:hypothetical protein